MYCILQFDQSPLIFPLSSFFNCACSSDKSHILFMSMRMISVLTLALSCAVGIMLVSLINIIEN